MKIRTLIQTGSILIILLFLPHHSRVVYFGTTTADWYGEFTLEAGGVAMGVMKNASAAGIRPELNAPTHAAIRGFDRDLDVTFSAEEPEDVLLPPRSYAVAVAEANDDDRRFARLPDGRRFEVKELHLVTSAERSLWALGYVAVLLGFGYLAYRGTSYFVDAEGRDTDSAGAGGAAEGAARKDEHLIN